MNHPGRAPLANDAAVGRRTSTLTILAVLAIYGWVNVVHVWEPSVSDPSRQPYNLEADAVRAGQLSLLEPAPEGLAQLPDPYDPVANASFREGHDNRTGLHDLSYYNGKLYLYFGVTPVVVLFWPWLLITGGHFPQELAVLLFCALGFVAGAWLFCQLARRFFPEAGSGSVAAGLVALGLAGGLPPLLLRPEVYEVAISCGHAFVILALAMVWKAIDTEGRQAGWLALASFSYGLAIAARPSLLPGAVILLAPVISEWRKRTKNNQPLGTRVLLAAAVVPVGAAGLAMMCFNFQRFGSPFEFGVKYQLAGVNVHQSPQLFGARFVAYNLRIYFLEPVGWTMRSIFPVGINVLPAPPPGYIGAENPFGIFTSVPFVWLAGALAFGARATAANLRARLGWIVGCVLALFLCGTATICAYGGSSTRYQAEFLPPLTLLAGLGLLIVDHISKPHGKWRSVVQCLAGLVLCYSVVVGLLIGASAESQYVAMRDRNMWAMLERGHPLEAIAWFEAAARRYPERPRVQLNLGSAYMEMRRLPEAIACFERELELNPRQDYAHNILGIALERQGKTAEARRHFLRALELQPNNRIAADNLARLERTSSATQAAPE